jgi:uncharacterized membrane protein YdjX (TVP38/TMEM64 family)
MDYLGLAALVFGCNLLPAFAPPTWTILVLYRLNSHLAPVPLILIGAFSAGCGRYLLARGTGLLRSRIPAKHLANLESAGGLLTQNRKTAFAGLSLFALSPLPSAQLFEAAGLIGKKLVPLTLAFFAGRLISYSIYVTGATQLKDRNLGSIFTSGFKSPLGIAIQFLGILGVYLLTKINWQHYLPKHNQEVK